MRTLVTTILAFVLSLMVGGMAAVAIASATRAQEEFILVFMAIPMAALISAIAFAIAQWRGRVTTTGRWLTVWLAAIAVGLALITAFTADGLNAATRDVPLLMGLTLPNFLILATQWLFVRWRNGQGRA